MPLCFFGDLLKGDSTRTPENGPSWRYETYSLEIFWIPQGCLQNSISHWEKEDFTRKAATYREKCKIPQGCLWNCIISYQKKEDSKRMPAKLHLTPAKWLPEHLRQQQPHQSDALQGMHPHCPLLPNAPLVRVPNVTPNVTGAKMHLQDITWERPLLLDPPQDKPGECCGDVTSLPTFDSKVYKNTQSARHLKVQ